jgi:hypothetical protein
MKKLLSIFSVATTALALTYLSSLSFSSETSFLIRRRAGGISELDGSSDRPLEASHLNHSKSFRGYDRVSNGVLVTDIQHLAYHLLFAHSPKEIGLTTRSNARAIESLKSRIYDFNIKNNLSTRKGDLNKELRIAMVLWEEFLYNKGVKES